MVKALASVRSIYYRDSSSSQLDETASLIFPLVIEEYFIKYRINKLSTKQQRRVAANVFHILEQGKQGVDEVPTWLGLTANERIVADSFPQYNKIEYSDKFTIAVSPAHELILFSMAGIPATLMAQWKTEEQLATFYVVRQAILLCVEKFANNIARGKDCDMDRCVQDLDESLDSVRVYRLQRQFKANTHETTYRYVPMVDIPTLMMNGDGSPFADIIAPYTLIQVWRAAKPFPVQVDLYGELQKGGLLKEDCDTGVLQGLLALWQLSPTMWENTTWQVPGNPNKWTSLVPPSYAYRYTVIENEPGIEITVRNGKNIDMSISSGKTITFLLSTDADIVQLELGRYIPSFSITKANLDEDLEVDESTLSDFASEHWRRFVNETIRQEVKVKFLFTNAY
jgi:hypothetical protein